MRDDHFEPVTIQTKYSGWLDNITNTRQVAEWLAGQRPGAHKSAAYERAVRVYLAHVRGEKDAWNVRSAFVDAAKEAGIFISDGRWLE